jgi:RNA polymerase sigma-70 factor (ECF subfamily)
MTDSDAGSSLEKALIARVLLHNDQRAFEQLVRRHQGMVRAQLRRLMQGDEAAADDLAQEAFLLAWKKLAQFRGDAQFSTWLHRIAYSCFLQARRREPQVEAQEEGPEPAVASARQTELQLDLARAMRRLSPTEQAVLLHCFQLGLSHEDASYVLGMPLGTVKTHAARGKLKLQKWMTSWRPDRPQGNAR